MSSYLTFDHTIWVRDRLLVAFYESLCRDSGDCTKSLKASGRPTCFDANNDGFEETEW